MSPNSSARYEIYEDSASEWRWRLVARNGNIVADSGQGYASWQGAIGATNAIRQSAPKATVEFPEEMATDAESE